MSDPTPREKDARGRAAKFLKILRAQVNEAVEAFIARDYDRARMLLDGPGGSRDNANLASSWVGAAAYDKEYPDPTKPPRCKHGAESLKSCPACRRERMVANGIVKPKEICPVEGCGLPQEKCESGLVCANGHGF